MNTTEINRLIALYVIGDITDEQLWTAIDTLSGETSTLTEEQDYDWDVDNCESTDWELEASRYDYL
jgi:hypothetical protein